MDIKPCYTTCHENALKKALQTCCMVLVYSNGCGHCLNMCEEWKAFAANCGQDPSIFNKNNSVHIMNIEAGTYSINGMPNIDGYPTVFGQTKKGDFIMYTGNRTEASFHAFYKMLMSKSKNKNKNKTRRKPVKKRKKAKKTKKTARK